ncbi:MAG: hypothetical protein EOO61_06395 [Hymenobacter sp.]|nr:MAG: hypothetical protein EOO61_06395 [Hymenobacter sp.]
MECHHVIKASTTESCLHQQPSMYRRHEAHLGATLHLLRLHVCHEMEGAGNPPASGANFPNMDFAAFARACGAQGFTARDPAALVATVQAFLAVPGPAILHTVVDPDEIPAMPHVDVGQAWKFGIAKMKEVIAAVTPS